MTGTLGTLLQFALERGLVAVAFGVAVLACAASFGNRFGKILADDYAKPAADSLIHAIANCILMMFAFVISWRAPRLVETLDEQLQWLEEYKRDSASGIELARQVLVFGIKMSSSAKAKEQAGRQIHVEITEGIGITDSAIIEPPLVDAAAVFGVARVTLQPMSLRSYGTVIRPPTVTHSDED